MTSIDELIKPLPPEALDDLIDLGVVCNGLKQPFDDVPTFDAAEDPEVDINAHLSRDRAMMRRPARRLFIDYRPNPDALKHLEVLPKDRESLHGVISGKYAMWELVPAIIERTGRAINELHIATLSYGASNAKDLIDLIDEGKIKRCSLVVSYYFKAQNRGLYDSLVIPLRERGQRVLAMRNHAKLMLIRTAGRGSYVIEGSANLRSCKNVEQFVLTRDAKLYRFHRDWLDHELLNRVDEGEPDAK